VVVRVGEKLVRGRGRSGVGGLRNGLARGGHGVLLLVEWDVCYAATTPPLPPALLVLRGLKPSNDATDHLAVPICRICGATYSPSELRDGLTDRGGCVSCNGSPNCAECGHPRSEHSGTYGAGVSRCGARLFDFQTLTATPRAWAGFVSSR
jgi:hypothetical protein